MIHDEFQISRLRDFETRDFLTSRSHDFSTFLLKSFFIKKINTEATNCIPAAHNSMNHLLTKNINNGLN